MVGIGDVTTWDTGCDLEHQSKKVMEEAAEVWWSIARLEGGQRTVEECCDVVQATCNLLSMLGGTTCHPTWPHALSGRGRGGGCDGRPLLDAPLHDMIDG